MVLVQVHSNCLDDYTINIRNQKCTFRDLRYMIVSPVALSVPVKEFEIGEEATISGN